jgi:hypothetical protein
VGMKFWLGECDTQSQREAQGQFEVNITNECWEGNR